MFGDSKEEVVVIFIDKVIFKINFNFELIIDNGFFRVFLLIVENIEGFE